LEIWKFENLKTELENGIGGSIENQ